MKQNHSTYEGFSIKLWAEDDRPREKMILKGRSALSDAELIAILIGSGSRKESAIELSKKILHAVQNDLNKLGQLSLKHLMQFNGIGKAKAVSIMAALELGRRRKSADPGEVLKISSSNDAYQQLVPLLSDLDHEQFYVLLLNRANVVLDAVKISQGGITGTVADAKLIFRSAVDHLASGIILAHNHPSGTRAPSQADIALTKKLVEAGKMLDVVILDHLIIAGNTCYSFADEGMI